MKNPTVVSGEVISKRAEELLVLLENNRSALTDDADLPALIVIILGFCDSLGMTNAEVHTLIDKTDQLFSPKGTIKLLD